MRDKRIIIAGNRNYEDKKKIFEVCFNILKNEYPSEIEIVHGNAPGVDRIGKDFAKQIDVPHIPFPAKWKDFSKPCKMKNGKYGEYNVLAGFNRNEKMAEYGNVLIAFWDGKEKSGTKDMIERAEKHDIEIFIYRYDIDKLEHSPIKRILNYENPDEKGDSEKT